MIRKVFVMNLDPDCESEYKRRHDEIWPELVDLLKSHGVRNYSISLLRQTRQLFGYVEIESESRWKAIANSPVCEKWWGHMSDIMETNEDSSPVSTELVELFHLD